MTVTSALPDVAGLYAELEFSRLCLEVAVGTTSGIGELIADPDLQIAVIRDIVRAWLALDPARREKYESGSPDSGVVCFAWDYIDAVSGEPFVRYTDENYPDRHCEQRILHAHWHRHARRLKAKGER